MYTASEKLSTANITDIMQTAYIDYSMSVIISRALPDARDGLKPVQRRILYAMLREGLLHNRSYDKCAGVVGEVLKNYHPHGDSSVYDTLVRLAQTWVMRYPLIDPQGNFGSVDGDPPAAYRYTECRLNEIVERSIPIIDGDADLDLKVGDEYDESGAEDGPVEKGMRRDNAPSTCKDRDGGGKVEVEPQEWRGQEFRDSDDRRRIGRWIGEADQGAHVRGDEEPEEHGGERPEGGRPEEGPGRREEGHEHGLSLSLRGKGG